FKVKKPVNLGFLDFSTLEKRRYFCQRELELNRRLAPEIYLQVVPIYKAPSGFSFNSNVASASLPMKSQHRLEADATIELAEYAVKMNELPHGWFLNELLMKNSAGEKEINRVISRFHRFYESEMQSSEIEHWGTT